MNGARLGFVKRVGAGIEAMDERAEREEIEIAVCGDLKRTRSCV